MRRFIAAGMLSLLSMGAALAQSPPPAMARQGWHRRHSHRGLRRRLLGRDLLDQGPARNGQQQSRSRLRNRSVIGLPILINMQPAGDRWEGQSITRRTARPTPRISAFGPDVLKIEGCVFGGLLRRRELDAGAPAQGQPAGSRGMLGASQIGGLFRLSVERGRARRPHQQRLEQNGGGHCADQR